MICTHHFLQICVFIYLFILFKMKSYIKVHKQKFKKIQENYKKYKYKPTIQHNKTIIQVCLSVAKNNTIEFNS